jgi:polyisoprenyl-phosphate glycosyltransferase
MGLAKDDVSGVVNLTVVIPVFNEELVIKESLQKIDSVLSDMGVSSEIIVVDDGSDDLTIQTCISATLAHSKLRLIKLAQNYGHMEALTVGMKEAHGSWIATIDADLQDPPSLLAEMYKIAIKGEHQVVQAVRTSRTTDGFFKKKSASIFYRLMKFLTNGASVSQAADFRLLSKSVAQQLCNLPERDKIYRLLIPTLGYSVKTVNFERQPRLAGVSKYDYKKMLQLALSSAFSFSTKPLQLITRMGFILSILLLSGSFLVLLLKFFVPTISGWTSIVLLILASNAFIIFAIGVLGEYIGMIFRQIQNRPTSFYHEVKI